MSRIKVLPDSVKKKIAAGEVIEGPFSVVKELIENSLDAGSSRIEVQVVDSGLKRIFVKDNGTGIHREDIKLVLAEHATSKISDIHDIEKISSFGFRGEAVSSIASVSNMTILSRSADEEMGVRLEAAADDIKISDYAGPEGATFIVENLFYNIPARKKFLKTRRTELRYIREVFLKSALAAPGVAFTLDVNGKRHITLNSAESPAGRVEQVYGRETLKGLYFETLTDIKMSISGFFSKPHFMKSSRTMQHLFINRRPVEYRYLAFILSRAYEAVAIKGTYPAALIFIDIDPQLIDVNIHPAKREVKVFDSKYMERMILNLIDKALNRKHKIGGDILKTGEDNFGSLNSSRKRGNIFLPDKEPGLNSDSSVYREVSGHRAIINESARLYREINNINNNEEYKIIGTAFETYIIVENKGALNFIDFHAAHERFIFDSLIAGGSEFESQTLVFPIILELPVEDYKLILENKRNFVDFGFDIDDFSDNTITVRAVPAIAGNAEVETMIRDFIESCKEDRGEEFDIRKSIASSVACHAAKRAGDRLTYEDMDYVVKETISGKHSRRCPHGRPYIYEIEEKELERLFKRS